MVFRTTSSMKSYRAAMRLVPPHFMVFFDFNSHVRMSQRSLYRIQLDRADIKNAEAFTIGETGIA